MKREECVKNLLARDAYDFEDLLLIMKLLRDDGGCAWDREQTHQSLRSCMIEEAYEVVEAIDREDTLLLREELGDVLFQVVFHAQMEAEAGHFEAADVVQDICRKMIRRHPHVFGDVQAETAEAVVENWEAIKREEKQRNTLAQRLRAIPPMLPALMRAEKISSKIGFAEGTNDGHLAQLVAQKAAFLQHCSPQQARLCVGELLMAIADYSAFCGLDAEHLLSQAADNVILSAENEEN